MLVLFVCLLACLFVCFRLFYLTRLCAFLNFARFLNLEKHGDNAEPTEGDGNNDALGTSIRRILTFIRRTSISSLGLPRPGRASPSDHAGDSVGPTIDRIERLSGVDEDTMLLTANTLRGNGYSGHERNGSNDGAA